MSHLVQLVRQFMLTPTPAIDSANYRTYVSFNIGTVSAFVVHLCLLPLFWWLGAFELIWLNVFSETAYVAALWVNRRGHHTTTIVIALFELAIHQALCVHYIGWDTGFQYYLLVLPAMVFFLPPGRIASQLALLVGSAAAFVGILAWGRDLAPVHPVAPQLQTVIASANIVVVFGLLAFFAFNYRRAAEVAEQRLAATERKQAEDRLFLLRAAVSAAQDVVVITDVAANIEFVNESFSRTTGYEPDEVVGENMRLLKSGKQPPSFYEEMWRTISGGRSWSGRMVNRRKNGDLYTESATITPIKDEEGTIRHYLAIKQDITDVIVAEKRLARTEEQLRQAQKMESIGRLAGGIAHDFNNLLTSILGSAEFLAEGIPEDDPARADVDEIKNAGERAASLTRQLLAYSRKQVLSPRLLDLNGVIRNLERLLRRTLPEQVELVLDLDDQLQTVKADEAQFGQVLLNLAVNASDAMPDGGVLLVETRNAHYTGTVSHNGFAVPSGRYAVVSVSDDGQGIPRDALPKVFEPFYTTKGVGKGTGLGLSTVYGIVTQSGGHVTVHSEPGLGTTFRVFLPASGTIETAVEPESSKDVPSGTETVLVVEDDPGVRAVALRVLTNCGYQLLEASNGQEALRILREHKGPVHLLLTDVMMPGIDGVGLSEMVMREIPEIKVLYVSGYPGEMIARHGDFRVGENFLSKPYCSRGLAKHVRGVLDR